MGPFLTFILLLTAVDGNLSSLGLACRWPSVTGEYSSLSGLLPMMLPSEEIRSLPGPLNDEYCSESFVLGTLG